MKKKSLYIGAGILWLSSLFGSFFGGMYLNSESNYKRFFNALGIEKIKIRYIPIPINKDNINNIKKKLDGELELYVTELDLENNLAVLQDNGGRYYQLTYDKLRMKGKLEEIEHD